MTWNHRIIKYLDGLMVVAEVYYDDDGRPTAYCRASVDGDTIEELWAVLEQHREALNKPVLEEAMFNHEGCGGCDVCYRSRSKE